ncbi:MAG TPA: hypothetical protein VLL52_16360 [Anaerolineae bacterium]|nr:hypothetical protein [Anaerolineae bacterium]
MERSNWAEMEVVELVRGCWQESSQQAENRHKGGGGACFELWRRALEEGDEAAWEGVQAQYQRLVYDWLHREFREGEVGEEVIKDLAQESWLKFWRILSDKQRHPLRNKFKHVGAVLKYLQRCVATICLDWRRVKQRQRALQAELGKEVERVGTVSTAGGPEQLMLKEERHAHLRSWLGENVTDPAEVAVLQIVFEQGLAPRKVYETYPELFAEAGEVRRVKERLLKRIRRAFL